MHASALPRSAGFAPEECRRRPQPSVIHDDPTPLPPGVFSPVEMVGSWVAAQVRPRHEKAIAGMLATLKVPYFLPLAETTKINTLHRTKHTQNVPVFAGYIFSCVRHDDDRYELVSRPNVNRIISIPDQAKFIREITLIHTAVTTGKIELDAQLPKGTKCKVLRGPFQGHDGEVVQYKGKYLLLILLTILGREVPTEIDACDVEPF